MLDDQKIILKNVKVHNLKSVDLTLEPNQLIVFTGVSGSGKSSLAFDTIYVEGQRRYVESLSTFARRYLGDISKPDVELVSGLSPTISIEQKTAGKNPRSTVGTITEIYDYLRVLFSRVGIPHCPISGEAVLPQSKEKIIKTIETLTEGSKIIILAPYAKAKKGEFKDDFQNLLRKGFMRARIDGQVRDLTEEISLDRNLTHTIEIVIDRLTIQNENFSRIAEAITTALEIGKGICIVFNLTNGEEVLFSTHAYSAKSGVYYDSLEPHDFSFNSPSGMCETCHGLGETQEFDLAQIIDPNLSIAQDCCIIASSYTTVRYGNIYRNLAALYDFDVNTPWKHLSEKAKKVFLKGSEKKWTSMHFVHPTKNMEWNDYIQWRGVLFEAHQRYSEAKSESYRKKLEKFMRQQICPSCLGSRLKPYPSATQLCEKKIHEISSWTIKDCYDFFQNLNLIKNEWIIAEELVKEITERLHFLLDVGLHYLTLDRTAPTLSGGEAQRVRLASQVGSGLVGVTYVLDEPSIGLHPRDNLKLIETLKRLRDIGNTVIVVEHDDETILAADTIVDFGPGPGALGGEIVVNGTLQNLLKNKQSLTGAYLSQRKKIEIPKERRVPQKENIKIIGATHHNLKNINATIPLGVFVAVTGVSGSGKSSLISEILFPALSNHLHKAEHSVGKHKEILGITNIDKVIAIDQSPIGRNPRSNPATYIKIFDEIRDLFSQLPESIAKGYTPGRFSFNVREGACSECHGMGMIKVDMDFMEDAWIACNTCKSQRFDHETLSIHYKGKSIFDVLQMTVKDAFDFFKNIPSLKHKLDVVRKVGMEYIQLGQPSTTLSGGEAQRIKLAKELVRPSSGKTLYILDEPTTGLHFYDIQHLLSVLKELVDRGNTVLVIEHNMDVVKTADWIIDIGPEGGKEGGTIVATGTPEELSEMDTPTGRAIKHVLNPPNIKQIKSTKKSVKKAKTEIQEITIEGAEQNNLKNLSLKIPRKQITICTGPSGSGKSSLAFETVYAEGQRRYIESLSPYARQFVKQMPKPKVASIEGLSPAIAIEQKSSAGNPRSTVGTLTEIYDYLRILYARLGIAYSPDTGEVIKSITKDYVVEKVLSYPIGQKITVLSPIEIQKNDRFEDLLQRFRKQGFLRIRLNQKIYELDEEIPFDRKQKNDFCLVIDRLKVTTEIRARLYEAVENAARFSNGKILIMNEEEDFLFNLAFAEESTGKAYLEITPQIFSFNSQDGMCQECQGLGYQYGANFTQHADVMNLSVIGLLRYFWSISPNLHLETPSPFSVLELFLKKADIDPLAPLKTLSTKQLHLFLNGQEENDWIEVAQGFRIRWQGIHTIMAKAAKIARLDIRQSLIPLLNEVECYSCKGTRLNPLASNVRINTLSLPELCQLPIEKALNFINQLSTEASSHKILEEVIKQLISRLNFLCDVGLNYMSLDRKAPALSNGEAQRIRLARQLGSSLTGILYVLDEPTIGLHPHDNHLLNEALIKLKNLGNTLLMVEHDPLTIATADYIYDFGPGAGIHGGHITAHGTFSELVKNSLSLTGKYLCGKEVIPFPKKRRAAKGYMKVKDACAHNLKNISVDFPIGTLSCITGVSGSGKSTIMHEIIRPAMHQHLLKTKSNPEDCIHLKYGTVTGCSFFNKLIVIDQNPIGHTVRSDVGSYVELLPVLREFYASLSGSRVKGLLPRHFSYNHRKGMCTHCWGLGYKKVQMHFLPSVKVLCDQCHGLRLNPVSLEVIYDDKNFGEILNTTIEEAYNTFQILPKAKRILETLISVGLGYLKLGQEIATLSGGEAQRMKLSRELAKRGTGKTLYLLDEPTTGLHPDDIQKLLKVLHQLVDKSNTMIMIEHNLDMIKNADFVIDIGPKAGDEGGYVICSGTPEEVAIHPTSYTAKYLKSHLAPFFVTCENA